MKPRVSIITLGVEDLQRSIAFYYDGLGLPVKGGIAEHKDHALFELQDGLSLVLYLKSELHRITGSTGTGPACMLSYAAQDADEVNAILNDAVKAGATLCGELRPEPWGYLAYFKDPDGHVWEIMSGPET